MPTDSDAIDTITYQSDGKTYRIPRGREAFVRYFATEFPDEADNIRRYTDAMYALTQEVDLFYIRRGENSIMGHSEEFSIAADEFIRRYITNPRLRDILAYMNPMYGGIAGHTPAYIHSLINILYIEGSSQFVGGSQQLADALRDVITQAGGQVIAGDGVVQIVTEERRVTKVITKKGREYTADWYIAGIHPCTMLTMMDETAFTKAYRTRLQEIRNFFSSFSVYIKFKPATQPYVNHPRYYQHEDGAVWRLAEYDDATWPKGFMYITPPTEENATANGKPSYASRMIVNCIMSFDVVRKWEDTTVGHRGTDYEAWKERLKQRILQKLEELHPGFCDTIDFSFASSPLTIRDYYGTKDGSLYGFQRDCQNILFSQIPVGTKVSNLLLTGQNINLHGICGVPLTSIEVAEAFVGSGTVIDKINEAYKTFSAE